MEEALKALEALTKQFEAFKEKQEKNVSAKVDKEEVATIGEQLKTLAASVEKMEAAKVSEALASIKKQMEEMAEDVARAKESKGDKSPKKSLGQLATEALKEAGVSSGLKKGERKQVEVNKEVADMGTGNVAAVGTNAIPWELSSFEPGLTNIQKRAPWLLEIANTSTTDKMYVQWAEKANQDGAAGETSEGADKNQIDFDWVEKSKKVEKVTAYIKTSRESLDDLDGLRNEIDKELVEEILLKVDADLLAGDGTTPTLAGILTMDTAYDAGSFAGTIDEANNFDVIRTAINQVVVNKFRPNYVLLHPTDVAKMDLTKGTDGHYVLPPFKSADGMIISGVRILENTGQTVDKFTVGDFTKFNVKIRKGVTIEVGYDDDDFTKNLVTILAEMRLVSYIKTNHAGAFVSGDFSDAVAALDTGS